TGHDDRPYISIFRQSFTVALEKHRCTRRRQFPHHRLDIFHLRPPFVSTSLPSVPTEHPGDLIDLLHLFLSHLSSLLATHESVVPLTGLPHSHSSSSCDDVVSSGKCAKADRAPSSMLAQGQRNDG